MTCSLYKNILLKVRQNELYEDDGDQYSTIKRSPYTKTNNGSQGNTPVDTEPPQQFQDQYEDRSKLNLIDQNGKREF